jgi:hypothetical protein
MHRQIKSRSRISVAAMSGFAVELVVAAADTVRAVKERVFAAHAKFRVDAQRIMYRAGPRGMEPLADELTLGDAGVARDGSAVLDVLIECNTRAFKVQSSSLQRMDRTLIIWIVLSHEFVIFISRCTFAHHFWAAICDVRHAGGHAV